MEKLAARILAESSLRVRDVRDLVGQEIGKSRPEQRERGVVEAVERVVSTLGDASKGALRYARKDVDALSGDAQSALRTKVEQAAKLILGLEKLLPAPKRPDVGTHGKAVAA